MTGLDPITLEVMLGSLRAACDEMGAVLVRSAHSANIKERRDASTALFDAEGQMVMQAEHIPVHLGAMPSAVAAVLDEEQRPGESWILNDPYRGGTHLPDITVITPLFHDGEPAGFAASRAHHADVGADEPGSMPALSRTLADEGVVIPPTRLTDEVLHGLAGRAGGDVVRLVAKAAAQEGERRQAEQRRDGEQQPAVGDHRDGGVGRVDAVDHERPDQAAVDAAEPARDRDQPAELADDVGDQQHADGRDRVPERREADAEHRDVEEHVAGGADDDRQIARPQQPHRLVQAVAEGGRARGQPRAH